jgi:hypothetical protein
MWVWLPLTGKDLYGTGRDMQKHVMREEKGEGGRERERERGFEYALVSLAPLSGWDLSSMLHIGSHRERGTHL